MLDTSRGRSVTFVHVGGPPMPPETMRRRESAKQMMSERRPQGGELAAAISNSVVKELARATGRGPTEARTTHGENGVFVVLQDTLTRGEPTPAGATPSSICADAGGA